MVKASISSYKINRRVALKKFRKKKSVWQSRIFWVVFSSFIFLGGLGYFVFFSGFFLIKDIQVGGSNEAIRAVIKELAQRELQANLSFFNRQIIFFVGYKNIEKKILDVYPILKSAVIKAKLPDALIIEPIERKPVMVWCYQDGAQCFLTDENCLVFEPALVGDWQGKVGLVFSSSGAPKILDKACETNVAKQIIQIEDGLSQLSIFLDRFILGDNGLLTVKIQEGWEARFDLAGDTGLDLIKLKVLLEKDLTLDKRQGLEYIDLRFSKAYYKYK